MKGQKVETRVIGGITYELWKSNCGKASCKSCPHGPYWYKPIKSGGKLRYAYIGKDLVKGEQKKKPWQTIERLPNGIPIPPCGPPGRCGCGRWVKELDAAAGFCPSCRAELTVEGRNVPCGNCGGRLPFRRLDADGCPTCDSTNVPLPFADRRAQVKLPARPGKSSPQEGKNAGRTKAVPKTQGPEPGPAGREGRDSGELCFPD